MEGIRKRSGMPEFYKLLEEMAETHDKKSHDYASDSNPAGNYHFAGELASLFAHSPEDAGFVGRIGEKIYRLSNLEKAGKSPKNESIEDTEKDICVIAALWMADRRKRRMEDRYAEDLRTRTINATLDKMTVADKDKLLNALLAERNSGAWE